MDARSSETKTVAAELKDAGFKVTTRRCSEWGYVSLNRIVAPSILRERLISALASVGIEADLYELRLEACKYTGYWFRAV